MAGFYRTIEVGLWTEMWFEELDPAGKLLFLYLLTTGRQTPCGAFQVASRSLCHETTLSADDLAAAMARLEALGKVRWWPETGWILLTRFYKHQRAKASDTYTVAARRAAAILPDEVYAAVTTLYPDLADPDHGVSHPAPEATDTLGDTLPPTLSRVKEKTVTERESSKQEAGSRRPPATAPEPSSLAPPPIAAIRPATDTPYALWVALCETFGTDAAAQSAAEKNRQLSHAKWLLEQGYGEDKVRRCLAWLRSQSWRTSAIDLGTVRAEIGKWELNGQPATAEPAARPAKTNGHARDRPGLMDRIARVQRRIDGTDTQEADRDIIDVQPTSGPLAGRLAQPGGL